MVVYWIYMHGDRVRETWDWFILIPSTPHLHAEACRLKTHRSSRGEASSHVRFQPGGRCWTAIIHYDVIKWKHFSRYWPFVRGIHRSPVNSPHKGQWRGVLMFSLICAWINSWVNNDETGDLIRRAQYDVTVMHTPNSSCQTTPLKIGCQ